MSIERNGATSGGVWTCKTPGFMPVRFLRLCRGRAVSVGVLVREMELPEGEGYVSNRG